MGLSEKDLAIMGVIAAGLGYAILRGIEYLIVHISWSCK